MTIIDARPLFNAAESTEVAIKPAHLYRTVSDLKRSGEWSPECRGGTWVGEPGQVGSVFRGENYRAEGVVGWAPLVRGTWFTEAEILEATAPLAFSWAMRTHTGHRQPSVWSFQIEPSNNGSTLTHKFVMQEATEGILKIVADLAEADRIRFVEEWGYKLVSDIGETLARVKEIVETSPQVHDTVDPSRLA